MKIGELLPDELPLVFDSWSRSFMKSPWAGCVRNCDYQQVMRGVMSEIVDRGATLLAGWTETEDGKRRVIGYSVSEPDRKILHWLSVKLIWRGMGYGRQLLKETVAKWEPGVWTYTFRTQNSARFLGQRFKWDPVSVRVK